MFSRLGQFGKPTGEKIRRGMKGGKVEVEIETDEEDILQDEDDNHSSMQREAREIPVGNKARADGGIIIRRHRGRESSGIATCADPTAAASRNMPPTRGRL